MAPIGVRGMAWHGGEWGILVIAHLETMVIKATAKLRHGHPRHVARIVACTPVALLEGMGIAQRGGGLSQPN